MTYFNLLTLSSLLLFSAFAYSSEEIILSPISIETLESSPHAINEGILNKFDKNMPIKIDQKKIMFLGSESR